MVAAEQVALLRWESRSEVDPIIPVCPVLLPLDKNLLVMGTISNAVDCIDFDHGSTSCALRVYTQVECRLPSRTVHSMRLAVHPIESASDLLTNCCGGGRY